MLSELLPGPPKYINKWPTDPCFGKGHLLGTLEAQVRFQKMHPGREGDLGVAQA